jgi:hypothetical protein
MLEVLHCVKKGYPKCRYILSLQMSAAVLVHVRLRGEADTDTASLEEHSPPRHMKKI